MGILTHVLDTGQYSLRSLNSWPVSGSLGRIFLGIVQDCTLDGLCRLVYIVRSYMSRDIRYQFGPKFTLRECKK